MLSINDYQLFRVGDIVELSEASHRPMGVVIEVGKYGQVHVFWPGTGKISNSGKKWAEFHLSIVEEYH